MAKITITQGSYNAWLDGPVRDVQVDQVAEKAAIIYERLRKRAYRAYRDLSWHPQFKEGYRQGAKEALDSLVNSL